jgi:hypothetical protein
VSGQLRAVSLKPIASESVEPIATAKHADQADGKAEEHAHADHAEEHAHK